MQRISAILLTSVAFSAGFIGCGDDEPPAGGGGAGGSSGSTTSSSSSSRVVSSSSGPITAEYLGSACTEDADCGPEGICVPESAEEGGPSGGYCTTACAKDSDCEGEGSACFEGMCYLGCILGEPEITSLDADLDPFKCHGRDELRCEEVDAGVTVCMPNCGSDSQCPGRSCDPRSSLCVDTPNPGLPLGAECDASAEEDPCAGWCVRFPGNVGACTQFCGFGGDLLESDCGGLLNGICLYQFTEEVGAGDFGACTKACRAHDDCVLPEGRCVDFGLPTNGFCIFESFECESNDDCDEEGDECTETPDGFFCLSSEYPLSLGTGGEGGGGGTGGTGGEGGGTGGEGGGTGGAGSGTGGAGSGTGGAGGEGGTGATTTSSSTTSTTTSGTGGAGGEGGTGGAGTTAGAGGAGGAPAGAGGAGGTGGAGGAPAGAGGAGGTGGAPAGAGGAGGTGGA
ncbi:hypothetical protein [Sorangium sp. So ce513]|uniref:hypothetical protein n=1 Tax=Sorangium sp. So ce513 TaxID=3133315 RepID=UPI003F5DDE60